MNASVIVLGATGIIGGAVVSAALEAGVPVIAVARGADALDVLVASQANDGLSTIAASVSTDAQAAALSRRLRALDRPFAGVVAAIRGDVERARLLDAAEDLLRRRLDEDLLPHLFAARHLLPLLADVDVDRHGRPGYVMVGGPGAEQPWAGYGQHSIAAASLRMLARVLHEEALALAVRVQLLAVDAPARTEHNARHACDSWPRVHGVARQALAMVLGEGGPAQAVVRHAASAASAQDAARTANAAVLRNAVSNHPPTAEMDPAARHAEGTADAEERRCLVDARDLLRGISRSRHPGSPHLLETPPS